MAAPLSELPPPKTELLALRTTCLPTSAYHVHQNMRRPFQTLLAFSSSLRPRTSQPLTDRRLASCYLLRKMSTHHEPILKKPVKIACIQLASGADKAANLSHAREKVLEAAKQGADIVVLPECFNSPYGCDYFPSYAEQLAPYPPPPDRSPSYAALSAAARDAGVYLVGGSIPELAVGGGTAAAAAGARSAAAAAGEGGGGRSEARHERATERSSSSSFYNTSLVFDRQGALLATHRKVHLFDIDIPGKIKFKESDVLSAGNGITVVDLPEYGRIGVAICYDIRFPELATVAARRGAFAFICPGAFNLTTGPLHWKLQGQARAMDNQIYVALCSPARDMGATYHAWGHSLIVDPMAKVLVEAEEGEAIVVAELDGDKIEETRKGIPLRDQRRFDVYPDVSAGDAVKLEDVLQQQ